jgi:hypothetical protein
MGVSPSRDFYKPHVERKQPDDNFHIASWGKIRFIQKFINILETWVLYLNALLVNNTKKCYWKIWATSFQFGPVAAIEIVYTSISLYRGFHYIAVFIYSKLTHERGHERQSNLLDSFLLLAKIKGEVVLALLAAPSYVYVPSPLQAKWPVPKSQKRNLTCSFARWVYRFVRYTI